MHKIYIFLAVITLVAGSFVAPASVLAQNYYYSGTPIVQPIQYTTGQCTSLTVGLYRGVSDVSTGGQVSALQKFLISRGYLGISAPTGFFGLLTARAVARYQSEHQLSPDGQVGVITRSSIQSVSCGNNAGGNYQYGNFMGTPVLASLSVTSGQVGTPVTIYGTGFDYANNIVNFNGSVLTGLYSYNGTSITFNVPEIYNSYNNYSYGYNGSFTIGTYPVYVTTIRGSSNSLMFAVTSPNSNCNNSYNFSYNSNGNCYGAGTLSVSNVSGPTSLSVGNQGSWSISLYNPNNNYVSVSAKWGDENNYNNYSGQQSSMVQGQQTITFTHIYQNSGYYNVVFTATDNNGAQSSVSASVNVSGGSSYLSQPYLSSINPSSGRVGTQVVIYGSGFTSYGNTVHFGSGGMTNISSVNGTTLYYTIPYTVSGCDLNGGYGTVCPMYSQLIAPATYPVYVSNAQGQTGTVYFNVTY